MTRLGAVRSSSARARRWLSWSLVCVGGLLLLFVALARFDSRSASESGLEAFRRARAAAPVSPVAPPAPLASPAPARTLSTTAEPDRTLWDARRIAAHEASLKVDLGVPLGVLRIRRLGLEVPIWDGVGELILNRGLGRIPGTARPGEPGNVGITGHRDGFFRVLERIRTGDEIELEILGGTERFAVERTLIVPPTDVSVLEPTPESSLTLVTCYPFHFVGSAPERFIVRAVARRANRGSVRMTAE